MTNQPDHAERLAQALRSVIFTLPTEETCCGYPDGGQDENGNGDYSCCGNWINPLQVARTALLAYESSKSEPQGDLVRESPMKLAVALDFADNPRPHHSLAAPADTNSELYEALRVLAAAYRALSHPIAQGPDGVSDAEVERALGAWYLDRFSDTGGMRAALEAARRGGV